MKLEQLSSFYNIMTTFEIAIRNGFILSPDFESSTLEKADEQSIFTVLYNFVEAGYIVSEELLNYMKQLSYPALKLFHDNNLSAMKEIKIMDKHVDDYVVYKNFPQEVLNMDVVEYWSKQLLIYWFGLYSPEEKKEKSPLFEKRDLKLLRLGKEEDLMKIFKNSVFANRGLSDLENTQIEILFGKYSSCLDIIKSEEIPFKEQKIFIAKLILEQCPENIKLIQFKTATDVLRLATGLSNGDISLAENTRFKLTNKERKLIMSLLENCGNLEEDVKRHQNKWEKLFYCLHIRKYENKYPKSAKIAQKIRNKETLKSFNSESERLIQIFKSWEKDKYSPRLAEELLYLDKLIKHLSKRPGEYARRIDLMLSLTNNIDLQYDIVKTFNLIISNLTTEMLFRLKGYFSYRNNISARFFRPKGSSTNSFVLPNERKEINLDILSDLVFIIDTELMNRRKFDSKLFIDNKLKQIKIPMSNRGTDFGYTSGSEIDIPENIKFIRSTTYWEQDSISWADNGWMFLDKDWKVLGTCNWNNVSYPYAQYNYLMHNYDFSNSAAIFSGDPVCIDNDPPKAAQMIDLYLDKLQKKGVRYAVYVILSYTSLPFDKFKECYSILQFGEEPEKGKLYDPSRAHSVFPITGSGISKNICYIDLETRKIIYTDVSILKKVGSLSANTKEMEERMPAIQNWINTFPSVFSVLSVYERTDNINEGICCLFSDKDILLSGDKAYIFKSENKENTCENLTFSDFFE